MDTEEREGMETGTWNMYVWALLGLIDWGLPGWVVPGPVAERRWSK